MNEFTNKDFIKTLQLIEWINKECSSRLGIGIRTDLSISECGSLSIRLTIDHKGRHHSIEHSIHQIEIRAEKYDIGYHLSNFISIAARELKGKIKEDANPVTKELKDTTLITVCSACLRASCWAGEFMCQQSYHAGSVTKTVEELRGLNLESPDQWKKQFCGDFDE